MGDIIKCLEVDPQALDGLKLVIQAFSVVVGKIPILAPQFFLKGQSVIIDAFLGAMSPDLPSFSVDDPVFGNISFKGKDLNAKFGLPVFDPKGLILMIVGMVKILLGLPDLFFDKGPPPVPKIPTIEGVLELIGISLGLQIDPLIVDAKFVAKFSKCLAKVILP